MIQNIEIDKDRLLEIFRIGAMSSYEQDMADYIKTFLDYYNIEYEEDSNGNIYNFTNYDRPLLAAHMDTVQDTYDYSLAPLAKIHGNILRSYGVLGGDDKCGIFIILHILEETSDINFAFFVEEEVGAAAGSTFVVKTKAEEIERNVSWSAVIDRRGNSDILCYDHHGVYGTEEFQTALLNVGKPYGFSSGQGTWCDADQISDLVSSCNVSAGYYGAHTKKEYVYIPDLINTIAFLKDAIININDKYPAPEEKWTSYENYYKNDFYEYGYGFEENNDLDFFFESEERTYNTTSKNIITDSSGIKKYYVSSLNKYFSSRELDELLLEIISITQEHGRIL